MILQGIITFRETTRIIFIFNKPVKKMNDFIIDYNYVELGLNLDLLDIDKALVNLFFKFNYLIMKNEKSFIYKLKVHTLKQLIRFFPRLYSICYI